MAQDLREKAGINLYSGTTLDIPSNRSERHKILKRDSQGFRVPDDDAIKFSLLSEEEAAAALCKSIIEVRDNIIIINKPYGIASHPGAGHKHSISELLPRVEHYVRSKASNRQIGSSLRTVQTLTLVHRLDKESTGLMLIARNQEASLKLKQAFANRWIKKDYLCITVGIPSSSYGYIRLPLVERNFEGVFKMCVAPLNRRAKPSSCDVLSSNEDAEFKGLMNWDEMESVCGESNVPTTFYKILDRRNDAALLTCSTLSGLKHQVRVHLAFGLHTPILGDHKYSHASFLAPQRLPHCLLDRLEIRQSKVRYMLLHLHAHRMRLRFTQSEHAGKQNADAHFFDFATSGSRTSQSSLVFSAHPPNYFIKNLRLIGLNLPRFISKI
ncbi:unnamed protein product [Calicophoron daubneyi]|uniref:Pseudouridylate synthase RPUSD4, mitochondrial n=1 Tax=Calicophoron daubneyi TaxID=300641 RepID=A0AAV2T1I3_CALDB